ncbi:unnamed protein product [Miscanthus lutarioriparius]|uniref:Peptidase A2 domain-containing protein n=1 Tax=Miscanthus lutarioriparius TaxID=422564 RepID=A0A811MND8_9POAL|nr:unnamed protein product [Miscanthus lutarioriparius]
MDPQLKVILDEIQKSKEDFNRRFDAHDEQWKGRFVDLDRAVAVDKRFDALESTCSDLAFDIGKRAADLEALRGGKLLTDSVDRVTALEVATTDLGTWRSEIEALADDLKIEELWDLLQDDDSLADTATPADTEPQVFLALSQCALTDSSAPRTVQFSGTVQGIPLNILLDSGSSTSFISESVAAQLSQVSVKPSSCQVRIAGGGTFTSAVTLLVVQWSIGQLCFTSDLWVLPLTAFDMIIGMDWLESFSPMQVHWQLKQLVIPYEGSTVLLQGESVEAPIPP